MQESRSSTKSFLWGLIAGGITGGLVALLYAPKSGRETRRDIGRKKDEIIREAGNYLDQAQSKASDILSDGRKKAENLISEARHKAESISKGAGRMYSHGKEMISDETSKIKDAIKAGVETYSEERNKKAH